MIKRLLSLLLLTALFLSLFPAVQANAVAKAQDSESDIRVMSANVRAEFASWASDGVAPEATSTRVLRLATMLEENNPMVVATQEMSPTWYTAFAKLDSSKWAWLEESDVAGYSYYNYVPNKGLALNSILYRKDLLTLYTHGVEAYTTRNNGQCIVWGVFTINATGKQVVIISTHWTPGSDKADTRLAQAEQLANKVNSLRNVYGDTVIVMGDFNCNDQTQEFRRFLINSNSVDSRPGADTRGDSLNKIDHITATGDASFTYHTICYEANGKYAISDHPFAVADVKLSSSLMFDFTDNADSRAHYKQGAYRHNAYDYHAAYWRYDTALVSNRTINKTDGTLTLNLTSKGNPYVVASTTDTLDPKSAYGLNFDPSGSQYASIRFRLNGCELIDSSVSPSVTIGAPQSGAWVGDKATYTLSKATSGYLSLTIKLTKNGLLSLSKMSSLYLSFDNIKNGTVTIDYIYVGQRLSKPISYALFFDYSNTSADQSRYNGTSYGGHNFDTGCWTTAGYGTTTDYTINTSDDTVSVKVKNTNDLGPVFATAPTSGSYQWNANGACLSYSPAQAEFMQIRFKLTNCQAVSGKNSRILLMYGGMYNGVFDGDNYENLANYTVKNGEFIIVTMPLSDLLRQAEKITQVGVRFQYIEGMTAGTATIDYLYIGPENGLPTKHVYNHKVTAATCTAQGYTTHTCATCGYSYKDTYTAVTKHTYTSKVTTAATCTKAGVKTYTCSGCGDSYTEAISATGHTEVIDKAVAATCTIAGKTQGSHCSVCNAVLKAQSSVPATGHSYTSKVTTAATCTKAGVKTFTCSKCNHTYTEAIAATGHKYTSKITTAPTCTAEGVKTYTCSNCGGNYTESLPELGHTPVADAAVPATCTNSGLTAGSHCSTCHAILVAQESVARLGHDYSNHVNNGETHTATCSRCNKAQTSAHSYTNGTCICGAKEILPPVLDESINILHTLNLASDIAITFAVPKNTLANYDSYYLECEIPKYEGNALVGSTTVQIQPVLTGSYYYFTLTGITAVQMNDMVDAVLHMTKGEQEYYSKTDSYSVATYAYNALNGNANAKMMTLCADLLRYGAEAQSYKKYRTDALVDADMTENHRSYLSSTDTLTFAETDSYLSDLQNPTITWVGKTLDLGSKVGIKFVFNTTNYSGDISKLSIKVTYVNSQGETTTVTLTGAEAYGSTGSYYSFTFYGLLASELRTAIDVAIYNGNIRLSETMRYSAETYASKTVGNALEPLTRALFAYSDSAKAYFTK